MESLQTAGNATLVQDIDHPHEFEMTDTDIFCRRAIGEHDA